MRAQHSVRSVSELTPEPGAADLAAHMRDAADVHQAILEETVQSAREGTIKESGRTACTDLSDLREPYRRYPRAVELAACPATDRMGTWHSHVTREQFLRPEHSLPDIANVAFSGVDASVVVGLEESHVLVAAADRDAMQATYRDVLGLDIRSTADVERALRGGQVPDPADARRRMFEAMGPLVSTTPTTLTDRGVIAEHLESIPAPIAASPGGIEQQIVYELIECMDGAGTPRTTGVQASSHERIVGTIRSGSQGFFSLLWRIWEASFDQAIGTAAGVAISNLFFEPARERRPINQPFGPAADHTPRSLGGGHPNTFDRRP